MTTGEKRMYLHDSLESIERIVDFIKSDLKTTSDFALERWVEHDWIKYNVNRIECLSIEIQNKLADWIKEMDNNAHVENDITGK